MVKRYYLIRCAQMERADRIQVADLVHLLRMIQEYCARYGVLDSLIEDGRA